MTLKDEKLRDRVRGNTLRGIEIHAVDGNSDSVDLTGASVAITFRHLSQVGQVSLALSTADGLTLETRAPDAFPAWIVVDPITIDMEPGEHKGDVVITWSNGDVQTIGFLTLRILQNVTPTP